MENRDRSHSHQELFDNMGQISIEDLTALKLMEEIMELDQEIKMKRKWMDARIKMLRSMVPQMDRARNKAIAVENFIGRISQDPRTIKDTDAIPMK